MQCRSIAGQLSLLALARQLTLLALAQLARQLKSLDFPHAIPANNVASANSSADIADASSASSSSSSAKASGTPPMQSGHEPAYKQPAELLPCKAAQLGTV